MSTVEKGSQLARITDKQGPLKPRRHPQQHVRTHLICLVDDRPRPGAIVDVQPLCRSADRDRWIIEIRDLIGDIDARMGDALVPHVVLCRQSSDTDIRRCLCHAVDQVVDLLVGLGDHHDGVAPAGDLGSGAHNQGRFAGTRWGIDHNAAVVTADKIGQNPACDLLDLAVRVRGGHDHASFASSLGRAGSCGGPPWVHGVASRAGNVPRGW
jgi:hypothetical protein